METMSNKTNPSAPRIRSIHLLWSADGSCRLLYDLERTFIFSVPDALQRSISDPLRPDNLSPALHDWLREEDLLVDESSTSFHERTVTLPQITDISIDLTGACNLACVYCFEHDINSRIGAMSQATIEKTLNFAFKKAEKSQHIAFHFGSGEPLLRFKQLKTFVDLAQQRCKATGKSAIFDLTTNATLVTKEIAEFFRDHPFNIRVSCDGPAKIHDAQRPFQKGHASYQEVLIGIELLQAHLPDRLTVNSVLSSGTRLIDLWEWAKSLNLHHYHVIKVGTDSSRDINLQDDGLFEYKEDLARISDDIFTTLEAGGNPIEFQPLTKLIRRLMIPEPITRFCGASGSYLGIASDGKVYPCFRHSGITQYLLGDINEGVDDHKRLQFFSQVAAEVDVRPVCKSCWARYLCGGGCYADSVVYGPDYTHPQTQHCPYWKLEIEQAIKLYQRLLETDPSYCLTLFSDNAESLIDRIDSHPEFIKEKACF